VDAKDLVTRRTILRKYIPIRCGTVSHFITNLKKDEFLNNNRLDDP